MLHEYHSERRKINAKKKFYKKIQNHLTTTNIQQEQLHQYPTPGRIQIESGGSSVAEGCRRPSELGR